jgi:hypothetical protein
MKLFQLNFKPTSYACDHGCVKHDTVQYTVQYTVIKIINTIQFCLVKFNIKSYITTDRQLSHIISMNPIFFLTVKMSLDFFLIIAI